jgi:DNA-binding protein H-NS
MTSFAILLAQQKELQAKTEELNKLIEGARKEERKGVIAKIKAIMAEHGLTVEDLGTSSAGSATRKASSATGKKVAPKYKNPATGETWTGRGIKPKWLSSAIEGGKTLESFLIAN